MIVISPLPLAGYHDEADILCARGQIATSTRKTTHSNGTQEVTSSRYMISSVEFTTLRTSEIKKAIDSDYPDRIIMIAGTLDREKRRLNLDRESLIMELIRDGEATLFSKEYYYMYKDDRIMSLSMLGEWIRREKYYMDITVLFAIKSMILNDLRTYR